jgi:hypothetical protein
MAKLDFTMRSQRLREWCWAAVSVSVDRFFFPKSVWTECAIASAELGLTCCDEAQQCNQAHLLDPPLKRLQRLKEAPIPRVLSFSEIQREIDAGNPICVRIQWTDGGGHFLVICGYAMSVAGVNKIFLEDSFYGSSEVKYEAFLTKYQGSGTWTGTFLLKG